MKVRERFFEIYQKEPAEEAFTPYRICPLGAHVDHQLGKILGFAIDKGVRMVYGEKENGIIEVRSQQFGKRAQWHVGATPQEKQNDWADYLRGATIVLGQKYSLRKGLCGIIDGELPIGGLSSSAAVTITYLTALSRINGIELSPQEIVYMAKATENEYVGVSCGKLDQSCEVYCKKDNLLYMDLKDDSYENIPINPKMKPYDIVVFFSGLERSLASSSFNARVDECRSAAYALKAYEGMVYGKFKETNLRDVDKSVFEKHKDKLPISWKKRAQHWYSECERVEEGKKLWKLGDIEGFGRLMFESGYSSIYYWEAGSPELKKLYELMKETAGVYGGRFSGAGFKGCCIGFIDPERREEAVQKISKEYIKTFPELEGKYSVYVCKSADGVGG